tara:strand:+ start:305 stop:1459 length:1155 start_codon:yes stop_codon:yes gene_type:complete
MRLVAVAVGVLVCGSAWAELSTDYIFDPDDGRYESEGFLSRLPAGFIPVPTIITEPAVGVGLAVTGLFFHESPQQRGQQDEQVLPSNISLLSLGATNNGSKGAGIGHLGFWLDDQLRYKGALLFSDLNLDFYSLGQISVQRPVELNLSGPVLFQQLMKRHSDSNWFYGMRQLYRKVHLRYAGSREIGRIPPAAVDLVTSYIEQDIATSGLGLALEYDSRDNPLGPTQGYNYVAQLTRFDDAIGSDVEYNALHLQGLNYWTLSPRWDLALRVQYDGVSGDRELPPYVLPAVDLRGISATRYQGESVLTSEVELTWKWRPQWKFNLFSGVGRAADGFSDLGAASSVSNLGGGFRYLVAERYGFWMGADWAQGPEDSSIYIQAGSNW